LGKDVLKSREESFLIQDHCIARRFLALLYIGAVVYKRLASRKRQGVFGDMNNQPPEQQPPQPFPQQPFPQPGKLVLPSRPQEAPPYSSDATAFQTGVPGPQAPFDATTVAGQQWSPQPGQQLNSAWSQQPNILMQTGPQATPNGKLPVQPENLIRPTAQLGPKKSLGQQLRTDPAYQVLAIALGVVVLASIVFIALAGSLFSAPKGKPVGPVVQATKVVGTTGPATSPVVSPEPSPSPIATAEPTSTPEPTATADATFTARITKYTARVSNGSTNTVTVQTNVPGSTVTLYISYGAFSNLAAAIGKADSSGVAKISWHVSIIASRNRTIDVTVRAQATNSDGDKATTQAVVVEVRT
jgi:hypothetical protein